MFKSWILIGLDFLAPDWLKFKPIRILDFDLSACCAYFADHFGTYIKIIHPIKNYLWPIQSEHKLASMGTTLIKMAIQNDFSPLMACFWAQKKRIRALIRMQ